MTDIYRRNVEVLKTGLRPYFSDVPNIFEEKHLMKLMVTQDPR